MPNFVESLGYIKCYSSISSRPIKSLAILSDTVRRSTVDQVENWTIRKQTAFLNVINKPIIHKFFKDFTNHRKKTNRVVVLCCASFLNIPNCRDHQRVQQSGKQDSFRHIWKSLTSMYEGFSSQFLRTTTGIESGPDAFDKSRLVITLLTNLGVTEILCSFRLVLEGKTGKRILESSRFRGPKKVFS